MDYTFTSKYARYIEQEKRRETWTEAVTRMRDMHISKYPNITSDIEWAFEQVLQKKVLGSQRALQFGGTPIEKNNLRIFNCSGSYCDRPRFFQEALYILLAGCGIGFSVQKHHVEKLPNFSIARRERTLLLKKKFIIPDSIEGWADSLGALISSYLEDPIFPEYYNSEVEFDYSQIRPKGSIISSGVGKAPGPGPLSRSLELIREILNKCILNKQIKLRPIDAYDIIMHAADAVLSGGVRRSACLSVFSPDDSEMITAKTGNWMSENPQRARSNNSALLLRDETSKKDFLSLFDSVRQYGEPGFIWADSKEFISQPCLEIGFYSYDIETGLSGWQQCNLSTINGKKIKSQEQFIEAARAAAIIGTLQAGYTSFPYLGEVSERITRREALLGVSMTGVMDNPDILLDEHNQREAAKEVKKTNRRIADLIGINYAARTTCLKPEGTSSCVLGSSSGIHPHHARRYFRRQQANTMEEPLMYYRKFNPRAVEKSLWSSNDTDEIISFCVEVEEGARLKNQAKALELLESVKNTRKNWIETGRSPELCTQEWLSHNVSNTITVMPDEWDDVADYIYKNRKFFVGISLLPSSGDLDYPQAPFVAVHTPREILSNYGDGSLFASGVIEEAIRLFNNLWIACDVALGFRSEIKLSNEQKNWVEWAHRFSDRYFDGDRKRMCYCLKEVHNWKLWLDLNREYVEVDFSKMSEENNNTNFNMEPACAGGVCEI